MEDDLMPTAKNSKRMIRKVKSALSFVLKVRWSAVILMIMSIILELFYTAAGQIIPGIRGTIPYWVMVYGKLAFLAVLVVLSAFLQGIPTVGRNEKRLLRAAGFVRMGWIVFYIIALGFFVSVFTTSWIWYAIEWFRGVYVSPILGLNIAFLFVQVFDCICMVGVMIYTLVTFFASFRGRYSWRNLQTYVDANKDDGDDGAGDEEM